MLAYIGSGARRLAATRRLCLLVLFVVWSIGLTSPSWAQPKPSEEKAPSVEDILGDFDEDEVLHNATEKTYNLPDMGAFAAYFPKTNDLATGISIELHDKQRRRGMLNWFKYDLYISEQRLGLAFGRKIFPVIDITVSAVYSRDFERNEDVWGFSVSLVDF